MSRRSVLLSGALRLAAAGLALAAVVMLSAVARVPSEATVEVSTPNGDPTASEADAWLLRANGWLVRVERVREHEARSLRPMRLPLRAETRSSISPFDPIIQRHAETGGFDWRLIAALISEESSFDPKSRSARGAYGLMQVRAIAARAVGETAYWTPEDNVRTGVRYLQSLRKMFWRAPPKDLRRLMLAAYHMGPSHLRDAQKLARRRGYDPYRWEGSMELILPLLEDPQIHTTLKHGFARGRSTVAYVDRVLRQFHHYQRTTAEQAISDAANVDSDESALTG